MVLLPLLPLLAPLLKNALTPWEECCNGCWETKVPVPALLSHCSSCEEQLSPEVLLPGPRNNVSTGMSTTRAEPDVPQTLRFAAVTGRDYLKWALPLSQQTASSRLWTKGKSCESSSNTMTLSTRCFTQNPCRDLSIPSINLTSRCMHSR